MERVVYIPIRKGVILVGLMFMGLLAMYIWPVLGDFLEGNWREGMYKPGIKGKRVIIDPGHGGADPGAVVNSVREADINLELARALKRELEDFGADVVLTREEKGSLVPENRMTYSQWMENLSARKEFAVENKGHLLISLHADANQSEKASGGLVYFAGVNEQSGRLASLVQAELNGLWGKEKKPKEKGFAVINFNDMPSILIEAGFLTSTKDLKLLSTKDGRERIAKAISVGIKEYCETLPEKKR